MDCRDYLALSGIQHYLFCRKQWALIHIEQQWKENRLTVEGGIMHARAHDEEICERRGDKIIVRGLTVKSDTLGFVGKCDVVEFHRDAAGIPLQGEVGLWRVVPVEYKRGKTKSIDADRAQLCAQGMCLEEMMCADIAFGYLYYGKTRDREKVFFSEELRKVVSGAASEMRDLFERRHTPQVRSSAKCRACSLNELCVPKTAGRSARAYMNGMLDEEPE